MGKGTASRQPRCTISTGGSSSSVKSAPAPKLRSSLDLAENSYDSVCTAESLEEAQARLRLIQGVSQESYNPLCSIGSDESTKEGLAAQFADQFNLREQLRTISSTPAPAHQHMAAPSVIPVAIPVVIPVIVIPVGIPVFGNDIPLPGCVPSQPLPAELHNCAAAWGEPCLAQIAPGPGPGARRSRKAVRKTVHKDQDGAQGTSQKRQHKGAATGDRAPPPATEEDWQNRQEKRIYAVERTKSLPVYYEHANSLYAQKKRLVEPDPYNRDFSKRMWEAEVATWRSSWREVHGVSSLMAMGYSEKASRGAWTKAGLRVNRSQAESAASEEHLEFQERLHYQHVQLAANIIAERT